MDRGVGHNHPANDVGNRTGEVQMDLGVKGSLTENRKIQNWKAMPIKMATSTQPSYLQE
jgi:hypothetical protein